MTDDAKFDVWLVHTELDKDRKDKKVTENLSEMDAQEYIYFEHLDEPSPDRADYWNYVAVPAGTEPRKYQTRSNYERAAKPISYHGFAISCVKCGSAQYTVVYNDCDGEGYIECNQCDNRQIGLSFQIDR